MIRTSSVPVIAAAILAASLAPARSSALPLDLAVVTCAQYQNEILTSTLPDYPADPIDTVMWLFGFSVAKAGERVMYGNSLTSFGFALDAKCKNEPSSSLLDAITTVKSKRDNPMDLTRLDCATFESRHVPLRKSDPQNANTLTMWLFGYAVGLSGGRALDAGAVEKFDASLADWCTQHPADTVFDALSAPNSAVPVPKPAPKRRKTAAPPP